VRLINLRRTPIETITETGIEIATPEGIESLEFDAIVFALGSATSDDPFCRDLCQRTGAVVISVDYRHAPESPFPAAVDDGFAALQWIAAHGASLGGVPGKLVVAGWSAGWSAGGSVAAVAAQRARDAGGPQLAGLPPAAIFTAEVDPLRDEGNAYAKALAAADVSVAHEECRGQIHTAFHAVDVLISPVRHRAAMTEAVKGCFR